MSPLTHNILRAVDYDRIIDQRKRNYDVLRGELDGINQLDLSDPIGPFMYPLLLPNGRALRKPMQAQKLYIPMLWDHAQHEPGYAGLYTNDILPLPIDQRYTEDDMRYMVGILRELMAEQEG